jgi:hypothetical protein
MHDPSFLAMSIHSPIPTRERWADAHVKNRWTLGRSRRTNAENLGEPTYPWWRLKGYRPVLAGRAFRFPSIIDIWHDEPGGRDSGEVCGYPHGWELRKHLKHLHVNVLPWQRLRRRLLTRCSWCGGPSRKGDAVNCSQHWDGATRGPWWHGELGLFHSGCAGVAIAHHTCTCATPVLAPGRDYGPCSSCSRFRPWRMRESARQAHLTQQRVAKGQRPTAEQRESITAAWAVYRAEEDAIREAERVIEDAPRG